RPECCRYTRADGGGQSARNGVGAPRPGRRRASHRPARRGVRTARPPGVAAAGYRRGVAESTQGGLDHLDHLGHLAALADRQDAFLRTVEVADPTVRVPWCGRWRVSTLVVHLARVHHWAAAQARRRRETPLGRGPFDLPVLSAECAAELRATLAELDPDARAWTLLDDGVPREQQRGTVRFWHRRQALETLVHLWDLHTALGEPYEPGPRGLAQLPRRGRDRHAPAPGPAGP